jgi:RNA 2',3'-cyclic 3'-phosphodiesterase
MKTHHTAVVVVPPRHLWDPIQAIRRRYDRHFERWMPHLTLLYPFRPQGMFDAARPDLERACASVDRFPATLRELRFFAHGRDRFTLWLAPEPAAPLAQLHSALHARFPDCDDVSSHGSGFVPHLSLGQAAGRAELEARLSELRALWNPSTFEVASVALLFRQGDHPFEVDGTVSLG